ncbi:hypothetical protein QAD02_012658 [Eretmocerus hayati]|uniref:Uncharacterized protein n=1 Tax=Eretmocerus hayati TaxID=131215 RepID=A0ACC2P221_9HYME|nr:hypothetical protein QAD02_012658 [Eretmocerus hayati]
MSISDRLNLEGTKIEFPMTSAHGHRAIPNCKKVKFFVASKIGNYRPQGAIAAPNISLPSQTTSDDFLVELRIPPGVRIESYRGARVQLLIGMDNWELLKTLEMREIENAGLEISRTHLRWIIHG